MVTPKTAAAPFPAAMPLATSAKSTMSGGGPTNIDQLTFACRAHHKLADKGWKTIKLPNGGTQWIPPSHLDNGQPRTNNYHHPEKLFTDDSPGDDGGELTPRVTPSPAGTPR